jgi:hypothetical protein
MKQSDFISYVGDADIHDASIESVAHSGELAEVSLKTITGRTLRIVFGGVRDVVSREPVGMVVYALTEMRCDPPYRKFIFANAAEDDQATLEIEAQNFKL